MANNKNSILKEKSFALALSIISLYKYLVEEKKEYVLSKQLLRSGTSIGANIREAFNGESKMDFIHKLAISQKECDETLYWIELLRASHFVTNDTIQAIEKGTTELLVLIKSSILTVKQKMGVLGRK